MADVKHILVVDDHFEMLEFLRSMLQLSSQDYEVLAVPSAEEGLLELRRGVFDLLITDVRLPGMSGFDLIRRARRLGLNLPVIMITAYSSAQGRKEAADLEVFHYFQKPLDTDDVLTAVNKALHGDEPALPTAAATAVTPFTMTDDLRKRLETLRVDTGALQLVLSAIQGQVLHSVGSGPRIDQDKLAAIIARNV
ncbi:MAG TPA: response regulator, partial [Chloroflexota bacterium]|nr:response regulator [Chloroflexota bacterium]